MDEPPDNRLPKGLPILPFYPRWMKRFERVALEVGNLLDTAARRQALLSFNARWLKREREVLAARLAVRDFQQRYTGSIVTLFRATGLKCLPSDMNDRARIYRLNAAFFDMFEQHRRKLGLPPRHQPPGPTA